MIIRSAEFITSALKPVHFPKTDFPEIAFAGRSNVGKSSLINTLLKRRTLVRTSRHPGQTRTLNFFLINDKFMLVDLPGYGFSRAPKEVIRTYQEAIIQYIKNRRSLVLLVLLLDIRRIPSKEDRAFYQLLQSSALETRMVLTKSDTLGQGAWKKTWGLIGKALPPPLPEPIYFSAKTGRGRDRLWNEIEKKIPFAFQ
ncbi:MAG: ribosome biogenesis GTP-binding protein YihA/YsxC [Thermodesulfobacteriota bacterium]